MDRGQFFLSFFQSSGHIRSLEVAPFVLVAIWLVKGYVSEEMAVATGIEGRQRGMVVVLRTTAR